MKYIEEFYLFVKVVQEGGFSPPPLRWACRPAPSVDVSPNWKSSSDAACCTDPPASCVSRTKGCAITSASVPLAEIEQATGEIRGEETDISGLIRLAAPIALSNTILVDMLVDFGLRYPGYSSTSASPTTMPSRQIRTGTWSFQRRAPQTLPNALCLGHIQYGLFASPSIWRRWGAPTRPSWKSTISSTAGPTSTGNWRAGRTDDLHQAHSRLCIDQTQAAVRQPSATSASSTPRSTMCTLPARWSARPRPAGLAVGKTSLLHAPLSALVHPVAC